MGEGPEDLTSVIEAPRPAWRRFVLGGVDVGVLGAVFDLNHPAHTVDWHFIHLSMANVVVIGVMLAVFALAILLPFPGAERRRRGSS
jgi:hypothetical protein